VHELLQKVVFDGLDHDRAAGLLAMFQKAGPDALPLTVALDRDNRDVGDAVDVAHAGLGILAAQHPDIVLAAGR
jgi:hypothetical protein